jgi:hypothetical protein
VENLRPDGISISFNDRVGSSQLVSFFRIETGMDSAEDDEGSP